MMVNDEHKMTATGRQYLVYLLVGVGVTLVTVVLRSFIGMVMPDDSTADYQKTIVVAYLFGIVISIFAHKSITFQWSERLSLVQILRFVGVHCLGMACNILGSPFLREKLLSLNLSDDVAKTVAFGIAAFLVSLVTFALKKLFVFIHVSTGDLQTDE